MKYLIIIAGLFFIITYQSVSAGPSFISATDSLNTGKHYDSLGSLFYQQKLYSKALLFYKKALLLENAENQYQAILNTNEKISQTLQAQKKYKAAIPYELRAVKIALKLGSFPLESYYQSVKTLLPKATDSLNLTRLYYKFSILLSRRGATNRAIGYLKKALQLAQNMKNDKAIATIANNLAGEYWDYGERKLSTQTYQQSLQAAIRLQDSNRIAGVYLNLSDNAKEQGDFKTGMKLIIRALKLKEHISDSSNLSFYYIKAGEISKAGRLWDKWEKYILKAYTLRNNHITTIPMEKAIIYENMGGIAERHQNPRKAMRFYDTLMQISNKTGYTNGKRVALTNQAHLFEQNGQIQKALKLIEEADQFPTENPFYIISSHNQKAGLYYRTKQYDKALRLLKKNLTLNKLNNYVSEKRKTFELLYRVNAQLRNYKDAFRWNDSLQKLDKQLQDKAVRSKMAELETQYQTEKKEHQIALLTAQNKISAQKIRIGVLLIVALIIIIVFGLFVQRMNKLKAEFREATLYQQLLRAQMNPHFIFNALTSIQHFMLKNETKKAAFYLGKFASISRLILEYSINESIPLSKEIEILQSYIELERMQKGYPFSYSFSIDESLETDFINIPPMALQPFVENAILHGLKEKGNEGHLLLKFSEKENILEVVIEDNGTGIQTTQRSRKPHHRSMAMNIFEKRRKLWEKRIKKPLPLSILDLSKEGGSGTRIIIHLPIL